MYYYYYYATHGFSDECSFKSISFEQQAIAHVSEYRNGHGNFRGEVVGVGCSNSSAVTSHHPLLKRITRLKE